MTYSERRGLLILLLGFLLEGSLSAQAKSHGYVAVGAGATDVNGGGEWVSADGPMGIGGEVGVGWVFLAAINTSYHLVTRQTAKHDVFATVGYAGMSSSEFSAHGVNVGGGVTYWPAARVGLRVDAFRFLPVSTDYNIRTDERSPSRYWGVRAGVALRFR